MDQQHKKLIIIFLLISVTSACGPWKQLQCYNGVGQSGAASCSSSSCASFVSPTIEYGFCDVNNYCDYPGDANRCTNNVVIDGFNGQLCCCQWNLCNSAMPFVSQARFIFVVAIIVGFFIMI